MNDALAHHGIKGMRWGVRRTPEQLGHDTGSKQTNMDSSEKQKSSRKKTSDLSDDELRQRIQRLNMEEQYDNLVARQKARDTGVVKKLLAEAATNLGRRALGVAVDKFIDKVVNKRDEFDINDWKNADVNDMNADTIQKVSKWYQNALTVRKGREALNGGSSVSENGKKDNSSSKEADSPKVNRSVSAPQEVSESAFTPPSKNHSENVTGKVPWVYRESGTAAKKEKERAERHDKKQYKWIG